MKAAALILIFALLPAAARAQDDAKIREAKAHYETARQHHDAGRYAEAATEYQAAYDVYPEPEFLFNIGVVQRLAGNKEEALQRFERYLELDPNGRGATDAKKAVEELRAEIGSPVQTKPEPPPEPEPPPDPDPQPEPAPPVTPKSATVTTRSQPSSSRPGSALRWAGIGVGAAGVLALGGGVLFGLSAKSASDDVSNATVWDSATQDRFDEGESAETKAITFYSIGAAAVVSGAVLYYLGHRAASESDAGLTSIAPVADGDEVALMASGRF